MNFGVYCLTCVGKRWTSSTRVVRFWPTGFVSTAVTTGSIMDENQNRMSSTKNAINIQYEEAVKALNGLQSNAATLEAVKKHRNLRMSNNVSDTQRFLERIGISSCELDKLPVIHLAGTKGKGSTCAFIESILREHGLKTGFYSSPHLVAVRERIRINGLPIAKKEFSHYFWEVYNSLAEQKLDTKDMPAYFKFLTILALKIFLKEEVDVAIIEVGIGGECDCTNVVRRPFVCGITSLDIDHTSVLGETIEEISWHKGGIIKPHIPVFTVSQQPPEALKVLYERAKEKQSKLFVVPPLEIYGWGGRPIHLGLNGYVQFLNASLALQLSRYFLKKRSQSMNESCHENDDCGYSFTLSEEDILGLENVVWPGRSQLIVKGNTTFFLDGAHTATSIQSCIDWYSKMSPLHIPSTSEGKVCKILLFNLTGDRDHHLMLQKLHTCHFDLAIFTTNLVTKNMNASSDQMNFTVTDTKQMSRCQNLKDFWRKLDQDENNKTFESNLTSPDKRSLTFNCISDALAWISCVGDSCVKGEVTEEAEFSQPQKLREAVHIQVLVTGSLHLIGGVLAILDPTLSQPLTDTKIKDNGNQSMADLVKRKYQHARYSTPGTP